MRVIWCTGHSPSTTRAVARLTAASAADAGRSTALVISHARDEGGQIPEDVLVVPVDPTVADEFWDLFEAALGELVDISAVPRRASTDVLPMAVVQHFAMLEAVRRVVRSGEHHVVVVDASSLSPRGSDLINMFRSVQDAQVMLERLLPWDRRGVQVLSEPGESAGVPLPREPFVSACHKLGHWLDAMNDLLTDTGTSVRLVAGADDASEVPGIISGYALFGARVDGVVLTGAWPPIATSGWTQAWHAMQQGAIDRLRESLPWWLGAESMVWTVTLPPVELAQLDARDGTALVYPDTALIDDWRPRLPATRVSRHGKTFLLHVPLPFASKQDVDLHRLGERLVIQYLGMSRSVDLTGPLRRCVVTGAAIRDGELRISFRPDPDKWATSAEPASKRTEHL